MLQNLGKPVVLTGSQVPFSERKNDALENLLDALDIAGHFMIPEVCLCFNSTLFRGNRTTKISASSFDAFASPNLAPLATITAVETRVSWAIVARPTALEAFTIQTNLEIHHVACLRVFPGIKPAMVDAVLRTEGLRGLILETFGAGNAPSGPDNALTRVIQAATQRGIVIVNITQCLSGSVNPLYASGMVLGRAGVVAGGDMTTEAALTKLSYLLALPGSNPDVVAQRMAISLRGEMTEDATTAFRHPAGGLSPNITQLTSVAYAIKEGDLDKVRDLLSRYPQLINQADYSGNTPLHLAATGPDVKILRHLLLFGASVHLRNYTGTGRTPLFLAANAGFDSHVLLLRQAGAHLAPEETPTARLHARQNPDAWDLAGISSDPAGISSDPSSP